jgi:hypothetical protein
LGCAVWSVEENVMTILYTLAGAGAGALAAMWLALP